MFLAASIGSVLVAAALSAPEEPSTAFRLFHDVCLISDGDRVRMIDAAAQNGFALQVGARPRSVGPLTDAIMLPRTADGQQTVLSIGWRGPLLSCVITSSGEQPDFTRDVEAWLGFGADPAWVRGSVTNYFSAQTRNGREPIGDATPEQQKAFLADGSLRVLWTSQTDTAKTLSFTAPPKGESDQTVRE